MHWLLARDMWFFVHMQGLYLMILVNIVESKMVVQLTRILVQSFHCKNIKFMFWHLFLAYGFKIYEFQVVLEV